MRITTPSLLAFFVTMICTLSAFSQTKAVTEKGDSIYVYDNGTWSYEELDEMPEPPGVYDFLETKLEVDTLTKAFKYSKNAKKEVKQEQGFFEIKYNDAEWKRVPPATLNEDADFAFESKSSTIWCVVISEETSIELEKLFLIARNTMAEHAGTEPEILKTEIRNVNGTQVFRGVTKTYMSGITFIFDTYYYSSDSGSVQFTTWTSDKLWEKNEDVILELLNGFVAKK